MGNYNFDIDLPEGIAAERMVQDILSGERGTIEVKRDFKVSDTGNIAIEYSSRGHKSGIAISKATWWAIVLDGPKFGHEVVILVKTTRLREMARAFYKQGSFTHGGDNLSSEMVLIPLKLLTTWYPPTVKPELL